MPTLASIAAIASILRESGLVSESRSITCEIQHLQQQVRNTAKMIHLRQMPFSPPELHLLVAASRGYCGMLLHLPEEA